MTDPSLQFTRAEVEALRAIASEGTIPLAANALSVSPHTVYAHVAHMRDKTGLRYLPQLVALAGLRGLLENVGPEGKR